MDNKCGVTGKIASVACRDFVTYEEVIFHPGDYLNVIIGPNGTGKSTLVAALVLGMGGAPKLLSRSSDIKDYIKNGKLSAWIEVKIYKNEGRRTVSFERSFDMSGKSAWKVDAKPVNAKAYLREIARFNIQIDNLCQFLPQDRVQDFAKMNPQELLVNTQNSVCKEELVEKFAKLKELRQQQLDCMKTLETDSERLRDSEQRNAELVEVIQKIEQRTRFLKKIEISKRKVIWLEYQQLEKKKLEVKAEMEQAKILLDRDKKNYDKVMEDGKTVKNTIKSLEKATKEEELNSQKLTDQLNNISDACDNKESEIRQAKARLESRKVDYRERASHLDKENKILEALVKDLKECVDKSNLDHKYKEIEERAGGIKADIRNLMDRRTAINRELDEDCTPEIQLMKRKLQSLQNVIERRLDILKNKYEHVHKAVLWLRQNQNLFEGKIYEPMILELNVKNPDDAKYLENSVSIKDLLAFTCTNKSDMNLLVRKLVNEQGLQINVLFSADVPLMQPKREPIERFRQYGFHTYLNDMIEGPAPIVNYLMKMNRIEKILIGDANVDDHSEDVPPHIRVFYSPSYMYRISVSRYTQEKSSMRTQFQTKNLLNISTNQGALNRCQRALLEITQKSDALKNQRSRIENEISKKEEERSQIIAEKRALDVKKDQRTRLENETRQQHRKVKRIQDETIDIKQEKDKFKARAKQLIGEILQLQVKKIDCLGKLQKASEKFECYGTKLVIFKRQHVDIQRKETDALAALNKTTTLVDNISTSAERCTRKCEQKLQEFKESCNGKCPDDQHFPYKRQFTALPEDLSALQEQIVEMQSRVSCMGSENSAVFNEFEDRKRTIETIKANVEDTTTQISRISAQITAIHNEWYPEILSIIETININFSNFMKIMNYVGEVQLVRNDENDYNSYGIKILVQYRDNVKLQALDPYTQSGGERAVAIAVYTLSMQQITNVPFRCVDEINQGMDTKNERKIFEMFVETTCQAHKAQYFFITPKLLPNLNYNEFMNVHIVFNGKHVADHKVFAKEV